MKEPRSTNQPTPCQQWQGKGGDAPPPPDYAAQAKEQGQQAAQLNLAQTFANRPTQITPFGRTDWTTGTATDPTTGQPVTTWTQSATLAPEMQAALNDQLAIQQGRSGLARGFLGRVGEAYEQPFDWSSLPAQAGDTGAATSEAFNRMEALQAPERQFQAEKLEADLANRGIGMGSTSYGTVARRASDEVARQRLQNLLAAGAEGRAQGQYQQGLRGTAIAEQTMRRQTPLNELNALLSGAQVTQPQMPAFTGAGRTDPANILGASQAGYNASLGAYNAGQAQDAANTQAGISAAATIAMIAML